MEIIQKVRELIANTPSVFNYLHDAELDFFGLDDVYCNPMDLEPPFEFDQNEEGEIPIQIPSPQLYKYQQQQQLQPQQQQQKQRITLVMIRTFPTDDPQINQIAEAQAELEAHLENNKQIQRTMIIHRDYFNYTHYYELDPLSVQKIKQTLILLSEWIISMVPNAQKQIYIERQSHPRHQFRCSVLLQYKYQKKLTQVKEIIIAATGDMGYILSEGWIISKLTTLFSYQLNQSKITEWISNIRKLNRHSTQQYADVLCMARKYFQSQ